VAVLAAAVVRDGLGAWGLAWGWLPALAPLPPPTSATALASLTSALTAAATASSASLSSVLAASVVLGSSLGSAESGGVALSSQEWELQKPVILSRLWGFFNRACRMLKLCYSAFTVTVRPERYRRKSWQQSTAQ
jgi:hypothetical protein